MMPPEYSHTLTRCVGQNQELQVDQSRCTIASGDRLLLCTDGLNKVVQESKIHTILKSDASTQTICQRLVGLALAEGGPDNITAVVACIQ
jgi:serine/threonine protein phosphatase PrpC